jgi:hypothetical protein
MGMRGAIEVLAGGDTAAMSSGFGSGGGGLGPRAAADWTCDLRAVVVRATWLRAGRAGAFLALARLLFAGRVALRDGGFAGRAAVDGSSAGGCETIGPGAADGGAGGVVRRTGEGVVGAPGVVTAGGCCGRPGCSRRGKLGAGAGPSSSSTL